MFIHSLEFDSCFLIVGKMSYLITGRGRGNHGCHTGIQPMWRLKKIGDETEEMKMEYKESPREISYLFLQSRQSGSVSCIPSHRQAESKRKRWS